MATTLRKIAELELKGQRYDLARNGEHYHLVKTDPDDYGQPRGVKVALGSFLRGNGQPSQSLALDVNQAVDGAQALLDVLGETVEKVQSLQAARERAMGGLAGVTT